jgi:perosamine synthetase
MVNEQRRIPMFHPRISESAIERVLEVLRTPLIGQGSLVDEFERALERRLNLPHVVAVNTSAAALRLALGIVGVGPGDEVITTPMTCTLTNHPILEQFATPVFADVQYEAGNIDPADIERRITPRTKAIICTHWGGTPCDLAEISEVAARHGLPVIEDASEALGATYQEVPIGNVSRFTALSFHAIQVLTTAEGGALATRSAEDADLARVQRWFGIDRTSRKPNSTGYFDFNITTVGYGYHLTNMAAALGLGNLPGLRDALGHRQSVANAYRAGLAGVPGLMLLLESPDRNSSNHFFTVHVQRRDDFCRTMKARGIETSIVHYRNDIYSVFGGRRHDLPNLDRFEQTYICLPTHTRLTRDDVERVVDSIRLGW